MNAHASGRALFLTLAKCQRAGNTSANGADNYAEATLRLILQGNKITVVDYFRPDDYANLDRCELTGDSFPSAALNICPTSRTVAQPL